MYRARTVSPALQRTSTSRYPGHQQGFLLMTAVVLIVIAALMLTVMVFFTGVSNQATVRHLDSKQALFIAGTGLERGIRTLLSPVLNERLDCTALTGDVNLTNIAFAGGRFTVTGSAATYPAAPTTLKLGISATDNTIPVISLAGYAAAGRVLIDGEAIDYAELEPADDTVCGGAGRAPCLVGAAHGRDGTAAAAHVAGIRLGQYQCEQQAEGGVPDLASSTGKRVLKQAVQLQEGWAVGDNGNLFRWNNTAWANVAAPVATQLNTVSILSYAEGWAVGDASGGEVILRWTGGPNWTRLGPIAAIPDTDLNSVYCVNSLFCWAVGNDSGGEVILRWTGGPNWTRLGPIAAIFDTNLNAVHCVSANDCWAVGNDFNPPGPPPRQEVILRWTGGPNWTQLADSASVPDENLNSVFCVKTDDCWAVGDAGGGGERPNLIHWNGAAWSFQNSGMNINEDLNGVFCVATDDCWAVGTRGAGAAQRPLILHWDGAAWSTRNSNLNINEDLSGIHCVTANDCWAAGNSGGGGLRPLLLHWDGTAWSVQNSGLNVNVDVLGIQVIGARRIPHEAWREDYQ
jgi:hypothetical protein